jgi:hypothetical protein
MANYLTHIRTHFEQYKRKVIVHNGKDIFFVADSIIEANEWGQLNYGEDWDKLHYFYVPSKFNKLRILTLKRKNLTVDDWTPTIPVKFFGAKTIEVDMLVDSGADITFINYQTGIDIGFVRTFGDKIEQAEGVGGDVSYILKQLMVEIESCQLPITIGWCLDEEIDDLLLGRKDVFDFFSVEFRQFEGKIIFVPDIAN